MRRALALPPLAALAVALAAAQTPAEAAVATARDSQGRTIRFDVRAPGVRVADYAAVLRRAVHGDEISGVTIRIVTRGRIDDVCGSAETAACYGGRTIVVPAGTAARVRHSLLHEYGHHVDATRPNPAAPGRPRSSDGTRRWWNARRMTRRLRSGEVAYGYDRGWQRSVAEIFAEDYVQLNGGTGGYKIGWLRPPSNAVLRALARDIGGAGTTIAPRGATPPAPRTLTVRRNGTLAPARTATILFGLLGPGRRVDFVARLRGRNAPASVRTALRCDGRRITGAWGGDDKNAAIRRRDLGPADCEITMTNVGAGAVEVSASLRLTRPAISLRHGPPVAARP